MEPPSPSSATSSSPSQTLETLETPSLTRSLSKLNAKAPEFVPRTAPAAVVSPPPQNTPGIIHVFPKPNSSFHHAHLPFGMPYHNPNKNDTPRMRLWLGGGGGGGGGTGFVEPNVAVSAEAKEAMTVLPLTN
nr:hypothetical protein [Tanacetum cinerariifolium]